MGDVVSERETTLTQLSMASTESDLGNLLFIPQIRGREKIRMTMSFKLCILIKILDRNR